MIVISNIITPQTFETPLKTNITILQGDVLRASKNRNIGEPEIISWACEAGRVDRDLASRGVGRRRVGTKVTDDPYTIHSIC